MTNTTPTPRPAKPKKPKQKLEKFTCAFCKREFTRETSLAVHVCEQKRRHMQRNDKPVVLGYIAYQRYLTQSMRQKSPSYDSFVKSNLYLGFVQFGRHLVDLNAINALGFIDFIIQSEAHLSKWTSPTLYNTYIREFINKEETPVNAFERSLSMMQQWAEDNNSDWPEFFRKVATPLAVLWITNGRISPWILFITNSADALMVRLNADQRVLINRCIDPEFWRLKIQRHQSDVDIIREILLEYGI